MEAVFIKLDPGETLKSITTEKENGEREHYIATTLIKKMPDGSKKEMHTTLTPFSEIRKELRTIDSAKIFGGIKNA